MPKCTVAGCKNPVVGGVRHLITVDSLDAPGPSEIMGHIQAWCSEHETAMRRLASGKRTRPLTPAELREKD